MTVKTLTVSGLNVAAQVLGGTGLTSSTTNGVTTLSVSASQSFSGGLTVSAGGMAIGTSIDNDVPLKIGTVTSTSQIGLHLASATGAHLQLTDTGNVDMSIGVLDGQSGLSFHTGRNRTAAGTELMRLTSAGNVGIGTSSPASTLHVVASNTSDIEARFTGGNNQGLAIQNASMWEYRVDADTGEIGFNYYGYNTGTTRFRNTVVYNGKNAQLAMFQGSTGRLGLGVSSPAEKLHINGNVLLENNNGFYIKNTAGTSCRVGAVDTVNQLIFGDGLTTSMYFTAGQNIYFSANGAWRGNINGTTGYWKIGDSTGASVPLDVFTNQTQIANVLRLTAQSGYFTFANGTFSSVNTGAKTIVLTIDSAETTTAAQITAGAVGSAIYGTGAGFGSFTGFSSLFTVTSATTTSNKLVITCTWTGTPATTPSNGPVTSIIIHGFRAGWGPQLLFAGMADGRDTGAIRVLTETEASGANAYMAFCTRGLETVPERMRLTSTGALGIGTTDPKSTLHVSGSQSVKVSLALATATTLDASHYIITTPATGNIGYTLPSAATAANRVYIIKRLTTGTVIITPASGDSIETGAANATFSIPAQYDSYTFVSDGTSKWYII